MLETKTIFCIWSGSNEMSEARTQSLTNLLRKTDCPILLLHTKNLHLYERKTHPFHPAYPYLSETHKADYLRCYIMHHYGGGYTDIKEPNGSWFDAFESLLSSDAYGAGYTEVADGYARVGGSVEEALRQNTHKLIGNCCYIFKPGTEFTQAWLSLTESKLSEKLDVLKSNPSSFPQDQTGVKLVDGTYSSYPLSWTEILGNIFHPLVLQYSEKILKLDSLKFLPKENYR